MDRSKIERYLAGQAVENINLPSGEDYFLRYFKFVHHDNKQAEEKRLYGIMVDLFKMEYRHYFDDTNE